MSKNIDFGKSDYSKLLGNGKKSPVKNAQTEVVPEVDSKQRSLDIDKVKKRAQTLLNTQTELYEKYREKEMYDSLVMLERSIASLN